MKEKTNLPKEQSPNKMVSVKTNRNKKIGLFLLLSPFIGLLTILVMYAIISVITYSVEAGAETTSVIPGIIKIILGLLVIVCVFGIIVCTPLGIFFLGKSRVASLEKYDERSGKKEASVVPDNIKGWSWGAFGLNWIWGMYHGVWISLLIFVPLVNLVIAIMLGIKGKEWAWRARKWESVDTFRSSQKKWNMWGIIFFIFRIIMGTAYIFFVISYIAGSTSSFESDSLNSGNETLYSENGISFACPGRWALTENSTNDISHSVTCERQPDIGNSGFINVQWFDSEIDTNELLSIAKSSSEEKWTEHNVEVNFSEPEEFTFESYPALEINYTFSLMSLKFQGTIVMLNCNNKSIMITYQEATEDNDKNRAGFETFNHSFQCG